MKKTFSIGGIHPAEHKTASPTITRQPLPMTACVVLSQHIGAPAQALVEKGQHVSRGECIAQAKNFISARIPAPISGTVSAIDNVTMPNGMSSKAIIIKASPEEHRADTEARELYWQRTLPSATYPAGIDAETVRKFIAKAGIVGLGGATFPSHVKAAPPEGAAKILIVNGCECEPYLTCDDALMQAFASQIVGGVRLMLKATGAPQAVIAIEDNKPRAIAAMKHACSSLNNIKVMVLKTKYPQGGEKQLIEAVTKQRVPSGTLPIAVGAVVNNVATAFAVWQAVCTSMPLIERIITVTGDIPADQQRNYLTAIGTPISELPFTLPKECRAILGGPMMGRTAVRLDAPVTKGTSGVLLLANRMRQPAKACIRCARCVDVCPMGLEPYLLGTYGRLRLWDEARAAMVADCIECGSCNYICPSSRPIVDYIRIAKQRSK